ncbi:MAG: ABC transporter permease [Muribaculaceae bacterium]|nr:ABC transporter permease [Muribaculaceae bacterium]
MSSRRDNRVVRWLYDLFRVWKREVWFSFHDEGVIIFFLVLCLVYPVLYALIYNTETARDVAVVVVDDDRSPDSRQFVRALDATPEVCVVQYAASLDEARHLLALKQCYGIVRFAGGYGRTIHRGEQAHVEVYCDMGLMFRYKQILIGVTNVQQALNAQMLQQRLSVVPVNISSGTIRNEQVPLGNTGMGLASAVLPAIFILVLQQSMLLGICMLHGGSRERRLHNQGVDPLEIPAGVAATILGKSLCYWMIYILPTIYTLSIAPKFFDFPQVGNLRDILVLVLPFLLATSFMGQALKIFANDRESTFIAMVFTSVIFVFLSGISWPRCSMSPLWLVVGNFVPSTWAVNAYVQMQSNGATLAQQSTAYWMLWVLAGVMFVLAYVVERFICRRRYRRMQHYAKRDPMALIREEYRRQAIDVLPDNINQADFGTPGGAIEN